MISLLESAVKDLVYISGIKHTMLVESFSRDEIDIYAYIRESSQRSQNALIRELPIGDFFRTQTKIRVAENPDARIHAEKFLELRRILEESFFEVKVYCIGLIHVNVFVIASDIKRYFVIKTEIVENRYQTIGRLSEYQRIFPDN